MYIQDPAHPQIILPEILKKLKYLSGKTDAVEYTNC